MLTPRKLAILRIINLLPGRGHHFLGINGFDLEWLEPYTIKNDGLTLNAAAQYELKSRNLHLFGREVNDEHEEQFRGFLQRVGTYFGDRAKEPDTSRHRSLGL